MLRVTSHFSKETYDYPSDLRETFSEMSRTVLDSIHTISHATSADEVTAALSGNNISTNPNPKTLAHALSRAALDSAEMISSTRTGNYAEDDAGDRLAEALSEYAIVCKHIGEARLKQDSDITRQVHVGWDAMSHTAIRRAIDIGKKIEDARLRVDAVKTPSRGSFFGGAKKSNTEMDGSVKENDTADSGMTESQRLEIEEEMGAFNAQVEDAQSAMKSVLLMPDSLKSLRAMVEAQQRYHAESAKYLADLLPKVRELEELQRSEDDAARAGV